MSNAEIVNLVAAAVVSGPVASIATQVVKRARWAAESKFLAAIALSALAGCAQAWLGGGILAVLHDNQAFSSGELVALVGCVFAGASAFYKLYFAQTSWAQTLGRI